MGQNAVADKLYYCKTTTNLRVLRGVVRSSDPRKNYLSFYDRHSAEQSEREALRVAHAVRPAFVEYATSERGQSSGFCKTKIAQDEFDSGVFFVRHCRANNDLGWLRFLLRPLGLVSGHSSTGSPHRANNNRILCRPVMVAGLKNFRSDLTVEKWTWKTERMFSAFKCYCAVPLDLLESLALGMETQRHPTKSQPL